jgi:hypothetical protein
MLNVAVRQCTFELLNAYVAYFRALEMSAGAQSHAADARGTGQEKVVGSANPGSPPSRLADMPPPAGSTLGPRVE